MMAFIRLDTEGRAVRRRRILINGEPNTRKTTSLLTFPRPLAIVSYPGEKGYDTIPLDQPDILPFIWTEDKALDSHAVLREVGKVLGDLLAGKHGKIVTLACDGLHKYVDYIMDATTDGAYFAGDEFEPKLYARGYRNVFEHLGTLMNTMLPVVVFTAWAEDEKDRKQRQGERSMDVPSHIMPALPGQLAKRIMGEFSIVVHQSVRRLPDDKPEIKPRAIWQTRAAGDVWGASIKGPKAIVERIPTYISGDYTELDRCWTEAEKGGTG